METLSDRALSVKIDGHLGAVQTRDKSWLVRVPGAGATVKEVVATRFAVNRPGSVVSPLADRFGQSQVFSVRPGDALVLEGGTTSRDTYWSVPGRSRNAEAMAVVFVDYPVDTSLLRPPAVGDGPIARFLRSQPIPESIIDVSRLPRVVSPGHLGVDYSTWGAGLPTIPYLTALLQRYAGEHRSGWDTDGDTPDSQHPGYGTFYASAVSQALVQLCSIATDEEKRPLALAVAQRGLDLAGAFGDGRDNRMVGGGHMAGRKALLVAFGVMTGLAPFRDPGSILASPFQEDHAYGPGEWWFGGTDWGAVWNFSDTLSGANFCQRPPSDWGSVNSDVPRSWAYAVNGYMPHVVGAQVGTALFAKLTGTEREISAPMCRMVRQWMEGPPSDARHQLADAGINLPWGEDYALVKGRGFCAAAYRQHAM